MENNSSNVNAKTTDNNPSQDSSNEASGSKDSVAPEKSNKQLCEFSDSDEDSEDDGRNFNDWLQCQSSVFFNWFSDEKAI